MTRRPTRAQLADEHTLDWLAERDAAETQPCPRPPRGCGVAAGQTCQNPYSRLPLRGPPAHPARILAAARAAAARTRARIPHPRDRSPAA